MINSRLVWYLEKYKLITPVQCGFRKQRSTTDHLVRLDAFVRESFVQRQHAVAVSFDLEKAYESTWKFGIMRDLHEAGLCGRLPYSRFHKKIKSFMYDLVLASQTSLIRKWMYHKAVYYQ